MLHEDQKTNIYVVEDHEVLLNGVKQYLQLSGFEVSGFGNLSSARSAISARTPDLLIQDVMLPDGDGFLFVKQLKEKMDVPVIFMTARGDESDRILGFELGADDYIVKPFSPKELVLRVEAVLRRLKVRSVPSSKKDEERWVDSEGNTMDFNTRCHQISINGRLLVLTAAEWRVMEYMITNYGQLETRSQILEKCFDYNYESYERIIDTHIKNLRAKLGGTWIETIRGYGYRFSGTRKD